MSDPSAQSKPSTASKSPVERLFPFAKRARVVVTGESLLGRLKKKLHFILVTTDLSSNRLQSLSRDFAGIPILQGYGMEDLESFFGFKQTKVIGFKKSSLSVSIYRELKEVAPRIASDEASVPSQPSKKSRE